MKSRATVARESAASPALCQSLTVRRSRGSSQLRSALPVSRAHILIDRLDGLLDSSAR